MLNSNVGTIKGGAIDYATLQKGLRIGEIANENELPMINMVESAGATASRSADWRIATRAGTALLTGRVGHFPTGSDCRNPTAGLARGS